MSVLTKPIPSATTPREEELVGSVAASPSGPVEDLKGLRPPPLIPWPRPVQVLWFGQRQANFMFHYRRKFGDV
jgi:hypothetical protein